MLTYYALNFNNNSNRRQNSARFRIYWTKLVELILRRFLINFVARGIKVGVIRRILSFKIINILQVDIKVKRPFIEVVSLVYPDIQLVKSFQAQCIELVVIGIFTTPHIPGRHNAR